MQSSLSTALSTPSLTTLFRSHRRPHPASGAELLASKFITLLPTSRSTPDSGMRDESGFLRVRLLCTVREVAATAHTCRAEPFANGFHHWVARAGEGKSPDDARCEAH